MKKRKRNLSEIESLRQKAEAKRAGMPPLRFAAVTEADTLKLLHELEVHQIELEMQHDELQIAREKAILATEKYSALYDFAFTGYFKLNPNGEIFSVNFSGANLLGKDRSALVNRDFRSFVSPDTRAEFDVFIGRVFKSHNKETCEVKLVLKDDHSVFVHIEGIVTREDPVCLITLVDISQRKHSEEMLSQKVYELEQFNNLVENAPDAFFYGDINGNFIRVNRKAIELTGYSREELLSMNMSDLFSNEEITEKPLRYDLLKQNVSIKNERTILRKDGRKLYVEMNSKAMPDGTYQCLFRDFSERRLAEEALQQSEDRYRKLVELSPSGIAIYQEGKFVYVNPAGLKIMGCSKPEELIGKPVLSIVHESSVKAVVERMELISSGVSVPPLEEKLIRIDGTPFDAEVIAVVTSHNGEPAGQVIVRDITKRKMAEDSILQINAQLKELNDTKDKLFSIIAHDLRSPFNAILGYSELLSENIYNYDLKKSEEFAKQINFSAKRIPALIDNLLTWANTQTGKIVFAPVKLKLNAIMQEMVDVLESSAKIKNISLNTFQSGEIYVYADQNMLKTILRNLISNAIKFTHPGGKVDVYAMVNKDVVQVTVSDNGVGIEKDVQDRLFKIDSETTTIGTANERGSGLGLILCKDFTLKHGGEIWVDSKPGKGSMFHFTLPLKPTDI